ncbi:MAG: 50S ribosomal protein L21 [bacterium]|jgi:large subunit ribosomal protein L21
MKKAVIVTGGKQYLVHEGLTLDVELLNIDDKTVTFDSLLFFDGDKVKVGQPIVDGVKVTAEIVNPDFQDKKVTSIRYKAKKRVHTVHGHRQHLSNIKITKISA